MLELFDEKYTLPTTTGVVSPGAPTTGIISLTGSTDGVVNTVTFTGTTNRIDVAGNAGTSAITVDLTDDVTTFTGKIVKLFQNVLIYRSDLEKKQMDAMQSLEGSLSHEIVPSDESSSTPSWQ